MASFVGHIVLFALIGVAMTLPSVFKEPPKSRLMREMGELKAMKERREMREKHMKQRYGDDPEVHMDTIGVLFHWGYYPQLAQVVTSDGYILTMHRVPCQKGEQFCEQRPVIFLQHGLESSSQDWVANMPWQSAAMMFADAGFDVWMGNFRGNTYGRAHVSLDPDHDDFWYFSFTEMGEIDLPAMINYVTGVTGQSQIAYVGHSEGTMTSWIAFAENPDVGAKISHNFALAPIGQVGHIQGLLRYIAPFSNELGTRLDVYTAHAPAGTSTQNVVHFGQNVNSGKFQKYDYGKKGNQEHYGQDTPPLFDITLCTTPVYMYTGQEDWLADPTDVQWLLQTLPNIVHRTELADTNHLDFVWGLNAAGQVYQPIINTLKATQQQMRNK